jgi:hypothetical protein
MERGTMVEMTVTIYPSLTASYHTKRQSSIRTPQWSETCFRIDSSTKGGTDASLNGNGTTICHRSHLQTQNTRLALVNPMRIMLKPCATTKRNSTWRMSGWLEATQPCTMSTEIAWFYLIVTSLPWFLLVGYPAAACDRWY